MGAKIVMLVMVVMSMPALGQKMLTKASRYERPLFSAHQVWWCKAVSGGTCTEAVSVAKVGESIAFLVELKGGAEAVAVAKEINVPVVIKWFRLSGDGIVPEWDVNMQQSNVEGFGKTSSYRTWMRLPNITRPGAFIVRLVFYDNTPLLCNGQPCEYQINVEE